jgi:hypothetical protein
MKTSDLPPKKTSEVKTAGCVLPDSQPAIIFFDSQVFWKLSLREAFLGTKRGKNID